MLKCRGQWVNGQADLARAYTKSGAHAFSDTVSHSIFNRTFNSILSSVFDTTGSSSLDSALDCALNFATRVWFDDVARLCGRGCLGYCSC